MAQSAQSLGGTDRITTIRLRPDQRRWLERRGVDNERTLAAEIRHLIEQARKAERKGASA